MSQVTRWDLQLQQLEKAIVEMMSAASNAPDPMASRSIVQERDQVDQALASIAIDNDKVFHYSRKVPKTNRANGALVYWAKQLGVKIKAISSEYVALQNRKMWLRLLQTRFSGTARGAADETQLRILDQDLRRKSGRRAEQCRDLATAMAKGQVSDHKIGKNHLDTAIDQVAALRDTVVRKFASVRARPIRPARPKLMQNTQKTARTEPHP